MLVLSVLKWDPLANLVKLTALSQEAFSLSTVTIVQPGILEPSFQITLLSMGADTKIQIPSLKRERQYQDYYLQKN